MSILSSKTVRSAVAITFVLSAMVVGNHERVLRQHQQEQQAREQLATNGPCYWVGGQVFCPG